ncbi:MAG: LPS-assembly protein LptD [Methyloceanibacter sp.]
MVSHKVAPIRMRRARPGLAAFRSLGFDRWKGRLCAYLAVVAAGLPLLFAGDAAFAISSGSSSSAQAQKDASDLAKVLAPPKVDSTEPMLLQADEMVYDNANNRVTAKGNVEIYYGNYILLADQVIYDRNANTLAAAGNVRIKDPAGAIITSDHMTLTDDFRDGFVEALRVVTKEDTRIVATTATREAGNVTVFEKGWFTPCKPCETNPDRPPTWRIRATKIIDRTDEATLTFRNAFFDVFGVPIIWVPYFQTADPTVKRKSGFLMPQYGQSTTLGTMVRVPYYFALADTYDFTFLPEYTSQAGTLLEGVWRQRLASGGYSVDLAGVFDDGSFTMPGGEDFRGSISTKGKFALDPYWSWGWDVNQQTDATFNRFYNIDTFLTTEQISQIYLEGLNDRNYFGMRFYETQNLIRPSPPDSADATVYPIIDYNYIMKNPILGGELSFDSNAMAFTNTDGTSSDRAITEVNWRRQLIDGMGEVFTPFAQLRGDVYEVNGLVNPSTNTKENGTFLTGNAVAGVEYRYPFIATTGSVAHVFEPIAQIIARPDTVGDQSQIPNEDARSLVFDDTILFDIDKFSGYDRLETGTRANVGFRYTAQLYSGAYARVVAGESYQLAGQNSFDTPEFLNSGLSTSASDYVTGIYLQAVSYLSFSAQTRFNQETLTLERTDLGSHTNFGPVTLAVNYAKANVEAQALSQPSTTCALAPALITPTTVCPEQEIQGSGQLALTDTWALLASLRYDLQNEHMITDGVGLQYKNDCLTLAVTYMNSNIEEQNIKPEQRVMVNLALKYLGAYTYSTDIAGLFGTGPSNTIQ